MENLEYLLSFPGDPGARHTTDFNNTQVKRTGNEDKDRLPYPITFPTSLYQPSRYPKAQPNYNPLTCPLPLLLLVLFPPSSPPPASSVVVNPSHLTQPANPTQQKLQLPIRRTRRILRDHMPRQRDLHPRQSALGMGGTENAGASQSLRIMQRGMIGHVEVVRRFRLEALRAVPGHVLDHQQGAVGDEDVIEGAVGDDGFVQALDDGGEDGEAAGRGLIRSSAFGEDGTAAFGPRHYGGVDGLLDVGAVEVDFCAGGEVVEGAREAKNVPEEWASSCDLIDVEAGVNEGDGVVDCAPEVAGVGGVGDGWGIGEGAWGWVDEVVVQKGGVAAGGGGAVEVGSEGGVEGEQRGEIVDVGGGGDLLLNGVGAGARVVDHDAVDIVVLRVVGIEHGVGDVRDVVARVTLSRDIDLLVVQAKCIQEVLEEAEELLSDICLIFCSRFTLRETCTHRLLHPHHIREIDPSPRVLDWSKRAILPKERTIFLQQTFQGTTSRTPIQPNRNLILRLRILGWKVPEIQSPTLIPLLRDWQKACIRLSDVKRHIWNLSPIDGELGRIHCGSLSLDLGERCMIVIVEGWGSGRRPWEVFANMGGASC